MKTNNAIPRSLKGLIGLGLHALSGAEAPGADELLGQNTAAKIATDLHAVTGDGTPENPGAQDLYAAQRTAVANAYAASHAAIDAGRDFCRRAISVLKISFGARWNSQWIAAGFVSHSVAVPANPVPMLIQLRQYFGANPDREIPALGVTAAQAIVTHAGVQTVGLALSNARKKLLVLKKARDAAQKALRNRLSGLRAELDQVLADDDGRWLTFGFHRPAEGRAPEPVESVEITRTAEGAAMVKWPAATRATSYRVTCEIAGSDEAPIFTGLFHDTQCLIPKLPADVEIAISITARNRTGESASIRATATRISVKSDR